MMNAVVRSRPARSARRPRAAFTLVELLIGISISGLIIGAAYSTYIVASDSWEKCRERSRNYQCARVSLSIMERYIQAVVPSSDSERVVFEGLDGTVGDTEIQSDSLVLITTGGIASARYAANGEPRQSADFCQVLFFLEVEEETLAGSLMMRRHRTPVIDPYEGGELAELAPNVVAFDVTYFDGLDWVDEWYLEAGAPEAIQIAIVFYDPDSQRGTMQFSRLIGIRTAG